MLSVDISRFNSSTIQTRTRLFIIAIAIVIYVVAFVPLYGFIAQAAIIFAILPILLAAILAGRGGGLFISVIVIPINLGLLLLIKQSRFDIFFWSIHLSFILVSFIVGYMQELIQKLLSELEQQEPITKILRQKELRYRALFHQSNDAVFIMNLDGEYLEVNNAAVEMLGYSHEEILSLSTPEIVAASEQELSGDVRRKLFAGEKLPIYERTLSKKDGTEIPVEINVQLVRDDAGNPLHIQSVARDIRERKETLDLIQKNEIRYRSLFQQSNDAVFIVDINGNFTEANDAAARMLGYTTNELRTVPTLDIVAPDERPKMVNVIQRLVEGETIPLYERNFIKKDGTIVPVEINVALIRDDDGNPLYIQSIARDITERQQAQKHDLMFALEVQKTQLLTRLIDDLSHDLRTPLSIIKTNVYLLEKLKDPEQHKVKLQVMEKQVNHLEKVFQDILTISRLEALGQPSFRLIKLSRVAHEIKTKFYDIAEQKSIYFNLQLDEDLPNVLGEKDTLYMAINELVENALNYTDNGGQITIYTYTEDKFVILKVEDSGCGISENEMPRIFDYFFRGDTARSIETGGAGLGLCIARKVIEVHGGTIEVESTLGQGSCFIIKLPYLDAIVN